MMSKKSTQKLTAEMSTIHVTRTIKKDGIEKDDSDEDMIAVHDFRTAPARVTVDYSLTINLGNYESARIGVAVQIPCYKEEIDEAYTFASIWAEKRIATERDQLKKPKKSSMNPL